MLIQQNTANYPLTFLLVSSDDHVTAVTGVSPMVTLGKNGGSFSVPAGEITEIGDGWYKVAGNATDTNTLGSLTLHATATGADPVDMMHEIVAFNPQSAVNLGLSNLDVAVSSRGTSTFDSTAQNVRVGTNLDKTGYSIDGVSGGTAAVAVVATADIAADAFRNGTVTLYARVYNNGFNIQRADIATLVYNLYLLDESDTNARTTIEGHAGVSLTVADVIFDAVQSDFAASNYNFKHRPSIVAHPAFTIAGRHYLAEYTITLTSGEKIIVRFKVHVL
jgi:hypothetical protein